MSVAAQYASQFQINRLPQDDTVLWWHDTMLPMAGAGKQRRVRHVRQATCSPHGLGSGERADPSGDGTRSPVLTPRLRTPVALGTGHARGEQPAQWGTEDTLQAGPPALTGECVRAVQWCEGVQSLSAGEGS